MTMVKVSSVNVMWVWLEEEGKGPEEIHVHVNMTLKNSSIKFNFSYTTACFVGKSPKKNFQKQYLQKLRDHTHQNWCA